MIKCDESMRRSKERARPLWEMMSAKWKCNKDCSRCVCGMKKNADGTWEHIKIKE